MATGSIHDIEIESTSISCMQLMRWAAWNPFFVSRSNICFQSVTAISHFLDILGHLVPWSRTTASCSPVKSF